MCCISLWTLQIDREGRIIDLEKNKAKLSIIEQEFKNAEAEEMARLREEDEMRKRVQKKRHEALDKARVAERMVKMKEDRQIRREIVRVTRGDMMTKPAASKPKRKVIRRRKKKKGKKSGDGASEASSGMYASGSRDDYYEGEGDALHFVEGGAGESSRARGVGFEPEELDEY